MAGRNSMILMHQDKEVADIAEDGTCAVHLAQFMPYDLQLTETDEPAWQMKNKEHFERWCAARPLLMERKTAGEFLHAQGYLQMTTDSERARISAACHAVSLSDAFWVRGAGENLSYEQIDPYRNLPDGEYAEVVLKDRRTAAGNVGLVFGNHDPLSVLTDMPNIWLKRDGRFLLLKHGTPEEVESELLASRIARCFRAEQVLYEPMDYRGKRVSACRCITSRNKGIVFAGDIGNCPEREGLSRMQFLYERDACGYHMMNIIDYLIGNTDRNWRNWGFLVDNTTNTPGKLMPLMDFNRSFRSYDIIEGDQCFTAGKNMTQKEAAIAGVQAVGLNQIRALPDDLSVWFAGMNDLRQTRLDRMFEARLEVLREAERRMLKIRGKEN